MPTYKSGRNALATAGYDSTFLLRHRARTYAAPTVACSRHAATVYTVDRRVYDASYVKQRSRHLPVEEKKPQAAVTHFSSAVGRRSITLPRRGGDVRRLPRRRCLHVHDVPKAVTRTRRNDRTYLAGLFEGLAGAYRSPAVMRSGKRGQNAPLLPPRGGMACQDPIGSSQRLSN
jgi:hypothetical protein